MKLKKARFRDGRIIPETYITENGKYYISKGVIGWNLYEANKDGRCDEYICTYETLREIRNDANLE